MRRRSLCGVAVASLFFSCGERCLQDLYTPWLKFDLPPAAATQLELGPSTVRTCLRDTCWSVDFDPSGASEWITYNAETRLLRVQQSHSADGGANVILSGAPKSDVSLEVTRDGGVLFGHAWTDVSFEDGVPEGSM